MMCVLLGGGVRIVRRPRDARSTSGLVRVWCSSCSATLLHCTTGGADRRGWVRPWRRCYARSQSPRHRLLLVCGSRCPRRTVCGFAHGYERSLRTSLSRSTSWSLAAWCEGSEAEHGLLWHLGLVTSVVPSRTGRPSWSPWRRTLRWRRLVWSAMSRCRARVRQLADRVPASWTPMATCSALRSPARRRRGCPSAMWRPRIEPKRMVALRPTAILVQIVTECELTRVGTALEAFFQGVAGGGCRHHGRYGPEGQLRWGRGSEQVWCADAQVPH